MSETESRSAERLEIVMKQLFTKMLTAKLDEMKTFDLKWLAAEGELLPEVSVTFHPPPKGVFD